MVAWYWVLIFFFIGICMGMSIIIFPSMNSNDKEALYGILRRRKNKN